VWDGFAAASVAAGDQVEKARPYDLHGAQIIKSDDLPNDCAKFKGFWHNRLRCKSYQRLR
jgi:hypothetical protein